MNISFFLTPKAETIWVEDSFTLRQTLEKMEYHHHAAVPIIDSQGKYIGTITEGDLLRAVKKFPELCFKEASKITLREILRFRDNKPVNINAKIDDLLSLSIEQSFVPVCDDQGVFIGIVTRRSIIKFLLKNRKQMTGNG